MKRKLQFLRRRHTDSTLSKVVREEGHLPGKVTPDLAQHWSRSLEDLLLDKSEYRQGGKGYKVVGRGGVDGGIGG